MEAALLLRDLWEVLRLTKHRRDADSPRVLQTMRFLVWALGRQPWSGEGVLF